MNKTISISIFCISVSFFTVLFISVMNFTMAIQKVNDYHYATVNEIESSDFSTAVMNDRISNSSYQTAITEKSIKEDLRIYEVKTTATLQVPILGYQTTYEKSSIAR